MSRRTSMMYWEQFPECCAIACLIGMSHEDLSPARLRDQEQAAIKAKKGLAIATVAEFQEPHAIPILKAAGYARWLRFKNPNTGNYVSVWHKKLTTSSELN